MQAWKRLKRWKRILIATVALGAGALIWASQSGWLLSAARQGLEDSLRQSSGREVHVGRLSGGFNGWVWLHDLSLGAAADGRRPDISVTAEALGLKLNWVQLVLHRRARLEDLQAMRVIGAEAYVMLAEPEPAMNSPVARAQDPLRALRLALRNAPLPPVRATLETARIWAARKDQRPALWLDQADIDARPENGHLRLRGQGVALGGTVVQLNAEADAEMKQVRAKLNFKHLSLGALPLPQALSVSAGTLEGQVDITAEPGLGGLWPGLRLEGSGRVVGAALRWENKAVVDALQARWSLKDQRLQVSSLVALAAQGSWKGDGSLDLESGALLAKASSPALDLRALSQLAGAPAGLSLSGKVAADLEASGALSATALSLGLRSKAADWRGQALSDLDLRWDRNGAGLQSLDARMKWDDGVAHVAASLDARGAHSGTLETEGVRAEWLEPWAGVAMKGRLALQGHWQGSAQGVTWEAKASAAELSVSTLDVKKLSLQSWGDSKAMHARVEGDALGWKGLNADLDLRRGAKDEWVLRTAKAFVGTRLLATADGRLQGEGKELQADLKAAIGPWPVTELPGLESLKGLSGSVQVSGQWSWAGTAMSGTAKLNAADLRRAGVTLPLSAALQWEVGKIFLHTVDLRHGELKAEGESAHLTGPYDLKGQLKDAELGSWAKAFDSPLAVSGKASGSLTWSGAPPLGSLSWDLVADHGQIGTVDFETLQSKGAWNAKGSGAAQVSLREVALLQKGGGRLTGELLWPWGTAPWKGDLLLSNLALGPGAWSGHLSFEQGKNADLSRQARLSVLSLDGQSLPELVFQGQAVADGVGPWRLTWGPELRLEGEGGRPQKAEATDLDLEHWAGILRKAGHPDLPVIKGRLNGEAQWSASSVSVSAKLSQLTFDAWDFGPGTLVASAEGSKWSLDLLDFGGAGPRLKLSHAAWSRHNGLWDANADVAGQELPYSLFTLGGQGHLKASGKGADGKLSMDWSVLQVGERRYEALPLDLSWKGGAWTLAPRKDKAFKATGRWADDGDLFLSSVESRQGKGNASLKGEVLHNGAISFDGQANGYPAGELTQLLGWPQDWKGATYGNLSVRGTTTTPRTIISTKIEDGSVQGLAFDLVQATVHIEDGWVKLAPLGPITIARKKVYALEVDGKVPLDDDQGKPVGPLEVRAILKEGGLGFFGSLPGFKAGSGPLAMELRFSGQRSDPTVNGTLKVTDGTLTPSWLLPPLEKVDLFVQIVDGQVELQKAEARVVNNGPLVRLETADHGRPAFVLERWEPQRFNLRLRSSASGLPVRSTPELRFLDGTIHPDLVLGGGWEDPHANGSVTFERGSLEKAIVTWPPQFSPPQPKVEEGAEPDFLDRLEWDLGLVARQDVMVRTDVAQIFVDTGERGLRLRGAAPHRSLEGRLTGVKGNLDYLFSNFDLATDKPSWVEFSGEEAPVIELQGTKKVRDALINGQTVRRDVDVRVHAYGPLGKVTMDLASDDSTLNKDQLASLAGLGVDTSDQRNQGGFAQLVGKVPGAVLTRYGRRTGLMDEVVVRLPVVEDAMAGNQARGGTNSAEAGTGAELSPTSKTLVDISSGKWVSEKLFVGVNGLLNERHDSKGSSVDPAVGGKVEYQLKNDARLSAQHNVNTDGQTEQRVMLERASSFENYNPRKRRWGQADVEPTPQRPIPTPTPTPIYRVFREADPPKP